MNATASELIPEDPAADVQRRRPPSGAGAATSLLLGEHLELDHTLHRVLPVLALQGLGPAHDGQDEPTQGEQTEQATDQIAVRDSADDEQAEERDGGDQLEV